MTAILLRRSKEPETCMACGRMATGLGVHEPRNPLHAWICSADCHPATRTLISMKANELNALEKTACNVAGQAVAEPILNEVMAAVWDAGIRDLSAATPDQVTQAILALNGVMGAQIETALVAFGQSVKQQISDGACPF